MKKENGYWVDKNGNKGNIEFYTRQKAIDAAKTLMDCTDCTNCTDCTGAAHFEEQPELFQTKKDRE